MADRTEIVISAKDETAAAFQAISGNLRGFDSSLTGLLGPLGGVYGAMTALAGTLGLVKFASAIGESIEFAGSLKNMSEKSGASVESLSQIAPAATIAGVGMDSVTSAVTKLSKGMADSDDKTKGVGKALDTLGLSARDSNGHLKDSGALYIEIAGQLGKYADGAGKTAIAQALLGKAGAEQIPVMNDLVEAQKYAIIVTDEQAAAADEYEKNVKRLGLAQSAMAKVIGMEVAPVLADFTKVLLDSATGAGGLSDNIKGLAADGSIRNWAQQAAIGIGYVIDAFDGVIRVVDIVGKAVAAGVAQIVEMFTGIGEAMKLALSGKFGEAADAVKASFGRMKSIGNEFVVDFDSIMSKSTFSDRLKAQFAASNAAAGEAQGATKKLGLEYQASSEKADKYAETMKKLVSGIEEGNDKLRMELATINDNKAARALGNVELEREKALRGVTSAATRQQINDLFDERAALVKAIEAKKEQKAALDEYVKSLMKQGEESIKAYDLQLKIVAGMKDETAALEKQITTFGMSKTALALYNLEEKTRLQLEKELDPVIRTNIENEHDKQQALILTIDAQEQAAEATKKWEDTLKQADAVGYDFFQAMGDGMEGIKDWAKNAGDALKKYLLAVLYEMTAKPFVVSIMTSIGGALGISGTANASGGGLPSINNLSSLSNLFGGNSLGGTAASGISSLFGASEFTAALAGDAFLPGALGAMGTGSAGMMSGLGAGVMAAIPWAGLAAMAIPLIMSFFDDGPAMRAGTFASGAASQGGNPLFSGSSAFGDFGVVNDKWFSDSDMGAEMGAFMAGIKGIDDALANVIGKDLTGQVKLALESVATEFEAGIEGEAVTFGSVMKERYMAVFGALDERLATVVAGFEGTGDALAQFLVTLADVYVMAERLPDDLGNVLLDVLAAGTLTVEEIGRFATAYIGLQEVLGVDPAAVALDALSTAQATNYDRVVTLRGGLQELVDGYDGTTASTEQLYGATVQYVQAQVAALQEINAMSSALAGMFADSHQEIEQFFWTNQQRASYLMSEVKTTTDLLAHTFDPTQIKDYATVINNDLMQAFKLLSPEEQKAQQASFLAQIEDTDELVKARLNASRQEITQDNANAQSVLGQIRTALDSVAQSMIEAAAAMKSASSDMKDAGADQVRAANTPVKVDVAVDQTVYVEYMDSPSQLGG